MHHPYLPSPYKAYLQTLPVLYSGVRISPRTAGFILFHSQHKLKYNIKYPIETHKLILQPIVKAESKAFEEFFLLPTHPHYRITYTTVFPIDYHPWLYQPYYSRTTGIPGTVAYPSILPYLSCWGNKPHPAPMSRLLP